jgi:hypothetical protein
LPQRALFGSTSATQQSGLRLMALDPLFQIAQLSSVLHRGRVVQK